VAIVVAARVTGGQNETRIIDSALRIGPERGILPGCLA
jgi:hypothetical protein